MREVDTGIKVTSHAFGVGELATIIIGDGMNSGPIRHESLRDSVSNRLGGLFLRTARMTI